MKNKLGLLGIAGIPLALIVGMAASVAMAAPTPAATESAPVQTVAAPAAPGDTDTETNDDTSVSGTKSQSAADTDTETNDDASGPQEAPGTEQAD